MLDFPNSPSVSQAFTAAGVTWTFDGAKWLPSGLSPLVVPGINDNRIINGDMRIDQRNNGASGTANGYTVDRWQYYGFQANKGAWQGIALGAQGQASGLTYGLQFTSSSAYTPLATDTFVFVQYLEADAIGDFAWGTAGAQSVTLSFWVYSSLTGTFSGSIQNYAGTRSYPFTYSIPNASNWYKIAVTIPGDTAGTWVLQGNVGSLAVMFELGGGSGKRGPAGAWASANYLGATGSVSVVGTNGAQFLLTGVKLEVGNVATPFNRQSLAKSMADCQRYYSVTTVHALAIVVSAGDYLAATAVLPVTMRAIPTLTSTPFEVADVNLSNFTMDTIWLNSFRCYGTAITGNAAVAFDRMAYASAEL